MDFINYVIANWDTIAVAVLAILGALSQLAALTPWTWDDKAFGGLAKIFKVLAGNYGKAKNVDDVG